jgi:hypothetical protein
MENVYEVSDFLLPEELEIIELTMKDREMEKEDPILGRVLYKLPLPDKMLEDIQQRVETLVGRKLDFIGHIFAEYESKYGQPNLPPHFDGDNNSLIIDYQYKSNTSWDLGVETEVFKMKDNKAIIFNPNQYPHWRPHKTFGNEEYVTMIFFRFPNKDGKIDYSDMRYSQNHEIFEDARKIRDSL